MAADGRRAAAAPTKVNRNLMKILTGVELNFHLLMCRFFTCNVNFNRDDFKGKVAQKIMGEGRQKKVINDVTKFEISQ